MSNPEETESFEFGRGIQFEFNDEQTLLYASFTAPDEFDYIDQAWVTQKINELSCQDWFVFDEAVSELTENYNAKFLPKTIKIAEQKDAVVQLSIAEDKMSAHMTLTSAQGGKEARLIDIKKSLDAKAIAYGIQKQVIADCIAAQQAENNCIAVGTPVIPGTDALFESLLPKAKQRCPQINQKGSIVWRDLGEIFTVQPGDQLMRRLPAKPGKTGRNVLGQEVKAKPVENPDFADGLNGTEATEEENVLVATITGQPVIVTHGIKVEPKITLGDVDLSTGHIKFDGSVEIKGNLTKLMKVQVTGDVIVTGIMEAAEIDAGGDVTIRGPVIGNGQVRDSNGLLDPETAIIKANGSISANLVEYGYLSAQNNIFIEDMALHSELSSLNEIIVGKDAGRGQLVGCHVRSSLLIKAVSAGSSIGVTTVLEIGLAPEAIDKITQYNLDIKIHETALQDINQLIASLMAKPTKNNIAVLQKAINTKNHQEQQLNELKQASHVYQACQERLTSGLILVDQCCYAGTHAIVNRRIKKINEDTHSKTFLLKDDHVIAS